MATVELDHTGEVMLARLRELLAQEPELPDPDRHDRFQVQELARAHDQWSAQVSAFRLLIGVGLVNAALESA